MYKIVLFALIQIVLLANTYEDAMNLYDKKEYSKALDILKVLSDNGNAVAQNDVGVMYESGQGTNVNYKVAETYYEKSALLGNSDAQYSLGLIRKGQKRYIESVKLFKKSAVQGNEWGQHYLAIMYQYGKGVRRNYIEAIKYYNQSIVQGNYISQANLAIMYEKGKGLQKSYKEAIRLYTLSANQHYYIAQYNLGMMYYLGKGTAQDKQKAKILFQKACHNGHGKGCDNLRFFKDEK
jgi:TPR repeat protein